MSEVCPASVKFIYSCVCFLSKFLGIFPCWSGFPMGISKAGKASSSKAPQHQGDPSGLVAGFDVLLLTGSPFRVPVKDVVDPGKVKCSGPGLGAGVRARVPQTFTVDCSQAGRAPLQVAVLGPTGIEWLGQGGGRWGRMPGGSADPARLAQVWLNLWRCGTMEMAPTLSTTPQPLTGPTR